MSQYLANHHILKRRTKQTDSTGLHYLESTIDVASGRTGWAAPVTSQARPCLQQFCYWTNRAQRVTERALSLLTSSFQNLTGGESCKMTNLPGDCLQAWPPRAPRRGKSNLHFFQRNAVAARPLITYIHLNDEGKDAEEVDNKSSLRTAHWDVLC